jgi:hypothetical protein
MRISSPEARLSPPALSLPVTPNKRTAPSSIGGEAEGRAPSSFSKVLERVGKEVDSGERVVNQAMHGGNVHDPAALLALQAGVYRYVEAVDLASKLVDRATSAVKTVLQGQ